MQRCSIPREETNIFMIKCIYDQNKRSSLVSSCRSICMVSGALPHEGYLIQFDEPLESTDYAGVDHSSQMGCRTDFLQVCSL